LITTSRSDEVSITTCPDGTIAYGRFMVDRGTIAEAAATVANRLDDTLGDTTRSIQELLVGEISELSGDQQLVQLLRDTVAVNVDAFFSSIRHGIPVRNLEPATAALEYARRLAQREVSVDALVRAYRLGHRAALHVVLDEIRASNMDPALRLDVYELMAAVSFEYIDWISQRVVAAYQEERERWLEKRNSLRTLQVRELLSKSMLSKSDMDIDAMTTAIRYPLRRTHLALVVWCDETRGDLAAMETLVLKLSDSIGAQDPLFVSVDRVTGWAWLPVPGGTPDAVARVRACAEAAADAPNAPHVAVGDPLPGVEGFRRSHQQALDIRVVAMAAGSNARRVNAFSDPGLSVAALLGGNVDTAAAWVGEVLGPLAAATEGDERLRETLRVFLRAGSSNKAAADELHLHVNSVKYRVQRAVERRARPITDDRLEVEVALLLCHWFGPEVLSGPQ
jgi:DNA-binding PucR family transcriptional regulator